MPNHQNITGTSVFELGTLSFFIVRTYCLHSPPIMSEVPVFLSTSHSHCHISKRPCSTASTLISEEMQDKLLQLYGPALQIQNFLNEWLHVLLCDSSKFHNTNSPGGLQQIEWESSNELNKHQLNKHKTVPERFN